MNEPKKYLSDLGLSDSEITIYLAMVSGARTARDLVKVTRLKRPTVYYALGCLEKRGLTSKTGLAGDKSFALEPIEKLATIAKEKALEATKLKNNIDELILSLSEISSPSDIKPTVAFFEGIDAVRNTIMEMLYCKNKSICTIAPSNNFFHQVGKDFVEMFIEERIKRKVHSKNLWENDISKDKYDKYYKDFSEIRIVPKVMKGKFQSTIFLYDDKTLYISSKNNSYCILITSKEHRETMQAMFDGLWSVSTPHN